MAKQGEYGTIQATMTDPTRKDYGMRVAYSSNMLRIKGNTKLERQFPDGCRAEVSQQDGHYTLTLTNRATGKLGGRVETTCGPVAEFILGRSHWAGSPLPNFGAVAPENVTTTARGVIVELPAQLPSVRPSGKSKNKSRGSAHRAQAEKPAEQPAPAESAPAESAPAEPAPVEQEATRLSLSETISTDSAGAAPQPAAVASQPPAGTTQTAARGWPQQPALPELAAQEPVISLRQAIRTVNAWKRLYPEKTVLSLLEDGTLRAIAEYE